MKPTPDLHLKPAAHLSEGCGPPLFEILRFLAQPVFVIPWYAAGAIAAVWVLYDTFTANRHVTPALKAAWPIIALFFSEIGLALYVLSCRPKHIGSIQKQAGDD